MKKATRFLALALAVLTLCLVLAIPASAYRQATYYKGWDIIYLSRPKYGTCSWNGGFLWLTKYSEDYFYATDYYRCWNYYHDSWVSNQGQTLTITTSKTKTSSISSTVSAEIGASYCGVDGKLGASMTTSESVSYSTSLGLSYNLRDYSAGSVRIAGMGYITEFLVRQYKNGSFNRMYYTFAFDHSYGSEITLVYR